jgi:hypothetical protein
LKKRRPLTPFDAIGFKRSRIRVAKWNPGESILEPLPAGRQAGALESLNPFVFVEEKTIEDQSAVERN